MEINATITSRSGRVVVEVSRQQPLIDTIRSNSFAAACFEQNTVEDLREALAEPKADPWDCEEWGLTPDQWRAQIRLALAAKEGRAARQLITHLPGSSPLVLRRGWVGHTLGRNWHEDVTVEIRDPGEGGK